MAVISIVVAARDLSRENEIIANTAGCGGEVIIVEGKNPSLQRNEGVRLAKGDIVYFIDDDSVLNRDAFERAQNLLETEKATAVLGGPAITPYSDTILQKTFGAVFASPWATGMSSARYRKAGKKRLSGEKELILCNMFIRKEVFEKTGGFKQELYPNEENEFLNRVQAAGHRVIYDPEAYIERSQRRSFTAFIRQCFTYGRGRAEQMLLAFDRKDIINTAPAFFIMYLLYLIFTGPFIEELMPLFIYIAGTAYFSIAGGMAIKSIRAVIMLFFGFPVLHIMYGTGFIAGIFKGMVIRHKKTDTAIQVKIISR